MATHDIRELGYGIASQASVAVTTTETSLQISGMTVYLHNVGTGKVFIDNKTGVSTAKWQLASGEKTTFPLTARGALYFISDSTATLNVLFLESV